MIDPPERALSIMQPWAALIVYGLKPLENRTWWASRRGPILIHTGKQPDKGAFYDVACGVHPVTGEKTTFPSEVLEGMHLLGGIVGLADITGCVSEHSSEWFVGPFAFVLENQKPLPFIPLLGQRGFFRHGLTELAA